MDHVEENNGTPFDFSLIRLDSSQDLKGDMANLLPPPPTLMTGVKKLDTKG